MRITIEYDEVEDVKEALNARKDLSAIEDAYNYLCSQVKHGDNTEAVEVILDHVRSLLRWEE